MHFRFFPLIALISLPLTLAAQTQVAAPFQIYGGYSYFSNSINGVPGSHRPLNGWDAAVALPSWHNLRFKFDVSGYRGNNLDAPQHTFFILGGPQYERKLGRERLFAQALFGEGGLNPNWGANAALGHTATFSEVLGGGVDTPVSRRFAFRVEGDLQHTNCYLIQSAKDPIPYRIPGLPNFFGRITAGVVWTPRIGTARSITSRGSAPRREPVESEVNFEGLSSFGHYHLLGYTWWSYLHAGGLEYDRHSWGKLIGARLDYVGEILPVVILRQPSKTDVFGDPRTKPNDNVPGLGISPLGLRIMWRDGRHWKPYYTVKLGMIGFTQKALSQYASYEDFTLQQSIGMQFKLTDRWDFRAGLADFHFSNGFIVPNNPGIDEMAYTGALSYHFGKRKAGD